MFVDYNDVNFNAQLSLLKSLKMQLFKIALS